MELTKECIISNVVTKTQAQGFKNFSVGDVIEFKIVIKRNTKYSSRGGNYAPVILITNKTKDESFDTTMTKLYNILDNFEFQG